MRNPILNRRRFSVSAVQLFSVCLLALTCPAQQDLNPNGVPYLAGPANTSDSSKSFTNFFLSDAALAGDTVVSSYVNATHVDTESDRKRIALFVARMKRAGLWNHVVDAGLLRTNYGALAGKTILGRTFTSGNLTFSKFGAQFTTNTAGVNQASYVQITGLPDMRTCTLIAVVRSPGGPDFLTWPQTLIGAFDTTGANGERISYDDYGAAEFKNAGAESAQGSTYFGYFGLGNYEVRDWRRRVVACTFAGVSCQSYYDGQRNIQAGYSVVNGFNPGAPLTVLRLGSDPGGTNALTAEVSAWIVLDNALTDSQAVALDNALLALEPGKRRVFIGDSQTISSAQELQGDSSTLYFTNGWPNFFMQAGKNADDFACWNEASSGLTTVSWAPGTGPAYNFLTNRMAMLAGEDVEWYVGPLGANDCFQSFSTATSINAESNLLAVFVGKGSVVVTTQNRAGTNIAQTVAGGPNWTAAQDTLRQSLNAWLRANPQLYDRLIDRDLIFTTALMNNTNLGGITRDGIHLRMAGNRMAAALALGIISPAANYDAAGQVTSATISGATLPTRKSFYPHEMFSSTATRDFSGAAVGIPDSWSLVGITGTVSCYVPSWATQAVVTVSSYQYSGAGSQGFYGISQYLPRDFTQALNNNGILRTVTTVVGWNYLTFTTSWPKTNAIKSFIFRKDTAAGYLAVMRFNMVFSGQPEPEDDTQFPANQ